MKRTKLWQMSVTIGLLGCLSITFLGAASAEKPQTYSPVVIEEDFETLMARDGKEKPGVMKEQLGLLQERYDLSNRPAQGLMMSGGRKAVQAGIRVKLPKDMTWEKLAEMSPQEIKEKGLFPKGFLPLPHAKHETGGQVFPRSQIDEIQRLEGRALERFDVEFDIPEHFRHPYS
jgi:cytochrome c peroxidase